MRITVTDQKSYDFLWRSRSNFHGPGWDRNACRTSAQLKDRMKKETRSALEFSADLAGDRWESRDGVQRRPTFIRRLTHSRSWLAQRNAHGWKSIMIRKSQHYYCNYTKSRCWRGVHPHSLNAWSLSQDECMHEWMNGGPPAHSETWWWTLLTNALAEDAQNPDQADERRRLRTDERGSL